jgi:hypothetical protein
MTPGLYRSVERDPDGPEAALLLCTASRCIAAMLDHADDNQADRDAQGIANTLNSIDMMIEIVKAALAWEEAKKTASKAHSHWIDWIKEPGNIPDPELHEKLLEADAQEAACRRLYERALARVHP